jgi:hypothetical protein
LERAVADNPLTREHWLGRVDPRPIALVRIALGATLLFDLAARAADVPDWFSQRGVLPLASMKHAPLSIFALSDRPEVVLLLFGAGVLVTGAFLVGYRTRAATALTWLFFLSLYQRNSMCDDGADTLARTLLFFGIFADLGAEWSLDRRAGRSSGGFVAAWPVRLMQLVLAVFYLAVARNKIRNGWLSGTVLYQLLQVEGLARPPAGWLLAHPSLCATLNHATWMLELAIPLLAYSPVRAKECRIGSFLAQVGLELGIAAFMRPGAHQLVMLACALLWMPVAWLPRRTRIDSPSPRTSPWRLAAPVVACTQAAIAIAVALAARRMPAWTARELSAAGLTLPTDLFSRPLPVLRWSAPGILADDTSVDILPIVRPELQPSSSWFSSRWFKFAYRDDVIQWPDLGRYLCSRWASRAHGLPALRTFVIVRETTMPSAPGLPPTSASVDEPWRQDCSEEVR